MTSAPATTIFAKYYLALDDGTNTNRAVARFKDVMDTTKTTLSTFIDCWIPMASYS
jgi:hypothetical protein